MVPTFSLFFMINLLIHAGMYETRILTQFKPLPPVVASLNCLENFSSITHVYPEKAYISRRNFFKLGNSFQKDPTILNPKFPGPLCHSGGREPFSCLYKVPGGSYGSGLSLILCALFQICFASPIIIFRDIFAAYSQKLNHHDL